MGGVTAQSAEPEPFPATPEPHHREPATSSEALQASVEEIRKRYSSDVVNLFPRMEDRLRRRLGVAPLGAGAAAVAGLTGVVIRLSAALLVTALAGRWAGVPWVRWAVLLASLGLMDAWRTQVAPALDVELRPDARRIVEGWTALLSTIERESDAQDLAAFTRRRLRLPLAVVAGVAVATVMLLGCWRVAPTGLTELHPGSLVLLAFLLYEFGTLAFTQLFWWRLVKRESGYDHRLFWLSPADSAEIRTAMQRMPVQSLEFGGTFTLLMVLGGVLTSWESPLVLPLGVGFLVIGYLTTIGSSLGDRAAIRRIIERARDQQLDRLQQQIDPFESRYAQLTPGESEQLRTLVDLHNVIRDAPTTSTTHPLVRAAAGLLVPTIVFVITVFGEVSAERILDGLLP